MGGQINTVSYSSLLNGLSSGMHILQVKVTTSGDWKYQIGWLHDQVNGLPTYQETTDPVVDYSDPVYFTVDNPPTISDLSIEDASVYTSTQIPLSFTVDEPVTQIRYNLDNVSLTCISGNTTLSVSEGAHIIVVYATNSYGSTGKSEPVSFTVTVPTPLPSPTRQPTATPTLGQQSTDQPKKQQAQFPQTIVVAAIAAVAVLVVASVAVLLVRRRLEKDLT